MTTSDSYQSPFSSGGDAGAVFADVQPGAVFRNAEQSPGATQTGTDIPPGLAVGQDAGQGAASAAARPAEIPIHTPPRRSPERSRPTASHRGEGNWPSPWRERDRERSSERREARPQEPAEGEAQAGQAGVFDVVVLGQSLQRLSETVGLAQSQAETQRLVQSLLQSQSQQQGQRSGTPCRSQDSGSTWGQPCAQQTWVGQGLQADPWMTSDPSSREPAFAGKVPPPPPLKGNGQFGFGSAMQPPSFAKASGIFRGPDAHWGGQQQTEQQGEGRGDSENLNMVSLKGLDSKYLPGFPAPHTEQWRHRMDEILGFRQWLESASAWLGLVHTGYQADILECVRRADPILDQQLNRQQAERAQKLFFLMKQAFGSYGRVLAQVKLLEAERGLGSLNGFELLRRVSGDFSVKTRQEASYLRRQVLGYRWPTGATIQDGVRQLESEITKYLQMVESFHSGSEVDRADLRLRDSEMQQLLVENLSGEARKYTQLHAREETFVGYKLAALTYYDKAVLGFQELRMPGGGGGGPGNLKAVNSSGTCFQCGKPGHFARECPGNGRGAESKEPAKAVPRGGSPKGRGKGPSGKGKSKKGRGKGSARGKEEEAEEDTQSAWSDASEVPKETTRLCSLMGRLKPAGSSGKCAGVERSGCQELASLSSVFPSQHGPTVVWVDGRFAKEVAEEDNQSAWSDASEVPKETTGLYSLMGRLKPAGSSGKCAGVERSGCQELASLRLLFPSQCGPTVAWVDGRCAIVKQQPVGQACTWAFHRSEGESVHAQEFEWSSLLNMTLESPSLSLNQWSVVERVSWGRGRTVFPAEGSESSAASVSSSCNVAGGPSLSLNPWSEVTACCRSEPIFGYFREGSQSSTDSPGVCQAGVSHLQPFLKPSGTLDPLLTRLEGVGTNSAFFWLLDSGASRTVISRKFLESYKVLKERELPQPLKFATANGQCIEISEEVVIQAHFSCIDIDVAAAKPKRVGFELRCLVADVENNILSITQLARKGWTLNIGPDGASVYSDSVLIEASVWSGVPWLTAKRTRQKVSFKKRPEVKRYHLDEDVEMGQKLSACVEPAVSAEVSSWAGYINRWIEQPTFPGPVPHELQKPINPDLCAKFTDVKVDKLINPVVEHELFGRGEPQDVPIPDVVPDEAEVPEAHAIASHARYLKRQQIQLELHRRRGHIPYDRRCPHCQISKGVSQHRRRSANGREHEIQADFMFVPDAEGRQLKFLVLREMISGAINVILTGTETTLNEVSQFFLMLGLGALAGAHQSPVTVVTDRESAVASLLRRVDLAGRRLNFEKAQPQSHQTVGGAEKTVRWAKEGLACLRSDLSEAGLDLCLTAYGLARAFSYLCAMYNRYAAQGHCSKCLSQIVCLVPPRSFAQLCMQKCQSQSRRRKEPDLCPQHT